MHLSVLLLAGLAASSTAAIAEPRTATLTVTPADFASAQARARLDRRIRSAIEQVCGSYASIESYQSAEMDSCWQAARAEVSKHLANIRSETRSDLASK
jgi:UrcA family protein